MSNTRTNGTTCARRASLKTLAALACACLAAACALTFGLPSQAHAIHAQWDGVPATGIMTPDEDSPIQVVHENLTFTVGTFPYEYNDEQNKFDAYNSSVRAAYTFYNPTDSTVSTTVLFPFGKLPGYHAYPLNEKANIKAADAAQYSILVNDEPVETTARYTLSYDFEQFQMETDMGRMADDYVSDPYYALELPVTKLVYKVEDMPDGCDTATIGFYWAPVEGGKILLVNQTGMLYASDDYEDQTRLITTHAENDETVTVYLFGTAADLEPAYQLFVDGSCTQELNGNVRLIDRDASSFARFALSAWSESTGVLPHDWYNAMVADLNYWADEQSLTTGVIVREMAYGENGLDLRNQLMGWYQYTITLAPEEALVNTVKAPLYPAIDSGYKPEVYTYTYLFSPASTWSSFGRVDVSIVTPFYLIESEFVPMGGTETDSSSDLASILSAVFSGGATTRNEIGFEQVTSAGYAFEAEGLPEGELTFTLSASDTPRMKWGYSSETTIKLIVVVAAVVAFVAAMRVIGKRKKAQEL